MTYQDIGHGLIDAQLWVLRDGRIEVVSTGGGTTHASCWGSSVVRLWRGRYEPSTGRISIIAPGIVRQHAPPAWLIDKLEERFGGGIDPIAFNPGGKSRPHYSRIEIAERVSDWLEDEDEFNAPWRFVEAFPIRHIFQEWTVWRSDVEDSGLLNEDLERRDWLRQHWTLHQASDPIVVLRYSGNLYRLIDGYHRVWVALDLSQETIPAFVGDLRGAPIKPRMGEMDR